MILRSFPITDFSPLEGALTGDWAPLGRVRGSSGLGSVEELRVYMNSPDEIGSALPEQAPATISLAPHVVIAYPRVVFGFSSPRQGYATRLMAAAIRRRGALYGMDDQETLVDQQRAKRKP
jgi:hypothetical protein